MNFVQKNNILNKVSLSPGRSMHRWWTAPLKSSPNSTKLDPLRAQTQKPKYAYMKSWKVSHFSYAGLKKHIKILALVSFLFSKYTIAPTFSILDSTLPLPLECSEFQHMRRNTTRNNKFVTSHHYHNHFWWKYTYAWALSQFYFIYFQLETWILLLLHKYKYSWPIRHLYTSASVRERV